jgi:hypothetical protein
VEAADASSAVRTPSDPKINNAPDDIGELGKSVAEQITGGAEKTFRFIGDLEGAFEG